MPSPVPPHPSPQLQVVLKWFKAFNQGINADKVLATLSDDYVHYVLPKSLQRPIRDKQSYGRYLKEVSLIFSSFNAVIEEITESPGKIVIHATSTGMSTTDAPYNNEYKITFHLKEIDGTGPLISCVKEFVDSKFSTEFFQGERQRQAEAVKGQSSSADG